MLFYRNINYVDTLSASASLRRLRDCGLLESKGKSSQTYYVPGKTIALKEVEVLNISSLSTELTPQVSPLSAELNPLSVGFLGIPADLSQELAKLGLRASEKKIKICAIKPFKLPEMAFLLKRNANYIRENYLMPLIRTGELKYVFPHQPNHPQQAYRTKS